MPTIILKDTNLIEISFYLTYFLYIIIIILSIIYSTVFFISILVLVQFVLFLKMFRQLLLHLIQVQLSFRGFIVQKMRSSTTWHEINCHEIRLIRVKLNVNSVPPFHHHYFYESSISIKGIFIPIMFSKLLNEKFCTIS